MTETTTFLDDLRTREIAARKLDHQPAVQAAETFARAALALAGEAAEGPGPEAVHAALQTLGKTAQDLELVVARIRRVRQLQGDDHSLDVAEQRLCEYAEERARRAREIDTLREQLDAAEASFAAWAPATHDALQAHVSNCRHRFPAELRAHLTELRAIGIELTTTPTED